MSELALTPLVRLFRAVSAETAKRIQGSSDADAEALDELPDDADRALGIIRAKLDDRLSVEYTVNKLIQEATEVTHLARIFSGESVSFAYWRFWTGN